MVKSFSHVRTGRVFDGEGRRRAACVVAVVCCGEDHRHGSSRTAFVAQCDKVAAPLEVAAVVGRRSTTVAVQPSIECSQIALAVALNSFVSSFHVNDRSFVVHQSDDLLRSAGVAAVVCGGIRAEVSAHWRDATATDGSVNPREGTHATIFGVRTVSVVGTVLLAILRDARLRGDCWSHGVFDGERGCGAAGVAAIVCGREGHSNRTCGAAGRLAHWSKCEPCCRNRVIEFDKTFGRCSHILMGNPNGHVIVNFLYVSVVENFDDVGALKEHKLSRVKDFILLVIWNHLVAQHKLTIRC